MRDNGPYEQPLSAMEADLAYFAARLTLVGETPASAYQRAQLKVFRTLMTLSTAAVEQRRAASPRRRDASG